MTLRFPAVLNRAHIVLLIDSREQRPLRLHPFRTKVEALDTGDYSIIGLENLVRLERKSVPDPVACSGRARERFERELSRLRAFPHRAVVIEADWRQLREGRWRGTVSPRTVTSSIASWAAEYAIPFHLAGDREGAEEYVTSFLWSVARHRHAEIRAMALEDPVPWRPAAEMF
ncbi:MAG: hypothetical protein JXP34_14210 [Planctomycetes bacterium]|nr:hypothetical protein [Planctomycetota bacterium]